MMGGMVPPQPVLPGRADFNPAPVGWMRTYNEPIPTSSQGGMDPKALKEAEAAVAAAMRFQGMRGFQQDVEGGLTPDKAILKHGPKMFYNNPDGFALALHRLAATPESDTGPAQTVPALDASGVPVPGVHILRSANGFHVIHDPASMENKQLTEGRKFQLSQLKDDLKAAKAALAVLPAASPRRAMAQAEVARLQQAAQQLLGVGAQAATATAPAPSGVTVRNKKTGQHFRYKGSADDVPADEFEVLQ